MSDVRIPEFSQTQPKRPGLSLLSKGLANTDEFLSKNPVTGLLSGLVGLPDAAKLLEKLAYGDRLTTGSGFTTKPAEGVVEGALPFAPALGKGLAGASKLAKGLARGR